MRKPQVHVVVGTRPEAIKMAPVFTSLKADPDLDVRLVTTGQHRELLVQTLSALGLTADHRLQVMRPRQSLNRLLAALLEGLDAHLDAHRPDLVLGHGDTTSCLGAALACFYQRVPFAHVEAGLRTHRLDSPFPEEFNRQGVARLADLHFAASEGARDHLLAEGVWAERIVVTGNPGLDALRGALQGMPLAAVEPLAVVTLHRRELEGAKLAALLQWLRRAIEVHPELRFVLPLHPSPSVREVIVQALHSLPNLKLLPAMSYPDFVHLLSRARVVLTDSGGVQEEAAFLGKPAVLLRSETERPDGNTRLLGEDPAALPSLLDQALTQAPAPAASPMRIEASRTIARCVRERLLSAAPSRGAR